MPPTVNAKGMFAAIRPDWACAEEVSSNKTASEDADRMLVMRFISSPKLWLGTHLPVLLSLTASWATAFCQTPIGVASCLGCFQKLRNGLLSLPEQVQGNKQQGKK